MKLNIAPKLFFGFLIVILLNVFFVVIVSKLTDLNVIANILKHQNQAKNHLPRISNLHRRQITSLLIYGKIRKQESADNFRQAGASALDLIDSVIAELNSVVLLDSLVSATDSADHALQSLQEQFNATVKQNHISYNDAFEKLVLLNSRPSTTAGYRERRNAIYTVVEQTDEGLNKGLALTDSLIEIQTKARIKEINDRVDGMRRLTLIIVAGSSAVSLLFGFAFSRAITNSLRRLREATSTIGKGEFDFNPQGYPKDEIGDLATAFFEMAYDLKRTQEELIRSKRLAAIGQIVASVNHEINNPLMIISGNAQFLEMSMEGYPQEMRERVRAILEETERISQVTRKLREIKNPVVEDYTSSGEKMINLDKSAS